LARLLKVGEAMGAWGNVTDVLALQAMVLQAQGQVDQAQVTLERALALGEAEGYVRTFVDQAAPMGEWLRQAITRGEVNLL
jgi:LuxR family maltose regulon positive regulatory protein